MAKLKPAFEFLAFPAAAVLCALASNAIAPAHRRVTWTGWVPASPQAAAAALPPPAQTAAPAPWPPPAPAPLASPAATASPLPRAGAPKPPPAPGEPQATLGPTRDISSEEAWAAFQQKVPFLDARRTQDFRDGHVAGAHSAPVWEAELDARLTEFEARVNPAPRSPIVLYCGGGDCEDSQLLARKLVGLGYRNLLVYRDGFPDWVAKGRPRSTEAQP